MKLKEAADKHEAEGGDRAAFVAGWNTMSDGRGLFASARAYGGDERAQRSFVVAFHDCDAALA